MGERPKGLVGGALKFTYIRIFVQMRKVCVILLLIPLAALFLEWMELPSYCVPSSAGVCMMGKQAHADHSCCQHKNKQQKSGTSACGSVCTDCPLCYVVTFRSAIRFERIGTGTKVEFSVIPNDNLSEYSQQHWKPPNSSSRLIV